MNEVDDFRHVTQQILNLSIATQGRETDWRGAQISLVFAKLGATGLSLLKLIPGSPFFGKTAGVEIWDLSSIAALCRAQVEAFYVLTYLRRKPEDPAEDYFQRLLWEYHEEFERRSMIRGVNPRSENLRDIEDELSRRKERLIATAAFQRLKPNHQRAILNDGKIFKLKSAVDLSIAAGVSDAYYRSQYKFCSAYVHCAPFSISQLEKFRFDCPQSLELIKLPVRFALSYSALSVREFVAHVPSAEPMVDRRTHELIKYWAEIMGQHNWTD